MALTDNLVSYYKLDESSGNAADSVGSNTLTNTGTMTYGTGKINNGAVIESGKYLSIADASQSGLDITGNMSINLWANFDTTIGVGEQDSFISKWGTAPNKSYNFLIYEDGGTRYLDLGTSSDGTTGHDNQVAWTPSSATWYMLTVTYLAATAKINFSNASALSHP